MIDLADCRHQVFNAWLDLTVGLRFNQNLKGGTLPSNLQHLGFGFTAMQNLDLRTYWTRLLFWQSLRRPINCNGCTQSILVFKSIVNAWHWGFEIWSSSSNKAWSPWWHNFHCNPVFWTNLDWNPWTCHWIDIESSFQNLSFEFDLNKAWRHDFAIEFANLTDRGFTIISYIWSDNKLQPPAQNLEHIDLLLPWHGAGIILTFDL